MDWKKVLGFGVLVWMVMFIAVSMLIAFKIPENIIFTVTVTAISLIAVYFSAKYLAPANLGNALLCGLVFAVVGIILDFLISQKFAPDIFKSVSYWVSYALVVLVPMIVVKETSPQDSSM